MLHPAEINKALAGMVVLADTREQPTTRQEARFRAIGSPIERVALSFGDYSAKFPLPDGSWFDLSGLCAVERKMSLDELAGCYTHDRGRFQREFERAREAGAKVYLLVENASWELAYAGRYRSRMTGKAMTASMEAWLARYNCQILMCKEETTGRLIHDILYREGKEALTRIAEKEGA